MSFSLLITLFTILRYLFIEFSPSTNARKGKLLTLAVSLLFDSITQLPMDCITIIVCFPIKFND